MFEFFTETYREIVKGEDVELEKRKKKEERGQKIIYSKDARVITYILGALYMITGISSVVATVKFQGFKPTILFTLFLIGIVIAIMIVLAKKTKKREIAAIILSIIFCLSLYGSTMLSSFLK